MSTQFLNAMKRGMTQHPVMHHEFLRRFESQTLTREQLKKFAIQWYKAARAHKLAFPSLIWNIPDDDVRLELIEILRDEYGNGDRDKIHAKLLMRFVNALGISSSDVEKVKTLPAVQQFSDELLKTWKDGNPVEAFGLHFALEFLASALHVHFANGVARYDFLSEESKEYFNYHKIAEQHHSDYSEFGVEYYASEPKNQALLEKGVNQGIQLMSEFWENFDEHIFGKGSAN